MVSSIGLTDGRRRHDVGKDVPPIFESHRASLRNQAMSSEVYTLRHPAESRAEAWCRHWRERHDIAAAARLARAHRQLIIEVATRCALDGEPSEDLIAEGQIGLMRAINRFDPDTGESFLACATRYVRAAVRDHVVRHIGKRAR